MKNSVVHSNVIWTAVLDTLSTLGHALCVTVRTIQPVLNSTVKKTASLDSRSVCEFKNGTVKICYRSMWYVNNNPHTTTWNSNSMAGNRIDTLLILRPKDSQRN